MSISSRDLLLETTVASALLFAVVWFASPGDPSVSALAVHPAWLPITVFAARYGAPGLGGALIIVLAPLAIASLILTGSASELFGRVHNPADLLALGTAVAAAWVGMSHAGRHQRSRRELKLATEARRRAEDSADELTAAVTLLRARCDRMDTSLTVWRELASRLEHGSADSAAGAALELCALRCPSGAAVVQAYPDAYDSKIVARRGPWTIAVPHPSDLSNDLTVRAAERRLTLVAATDIEGARESDADVAVPVLDESNGDLVGMIAMRGVSPDDLRAAELRDLKLIAAWLSAPLARMASKPRLRAVHEESY